MIKQQRTDLQSRKRRGRVVQYSDLSSDHLSQHQSVTLAAIAKKIALIKGYDFAGEYDPTQPSAGPLYFVPSETLVGLEAARQLGILSEHDLFGGVVPYSFVATKTISHQLVHAHAFAPEGWSHEFGQRVKEAVLFGFTAFTIADARCAAELVLKRGPARLKPARGTGGRGQRVISGLADFEAVLDHLEPVELSRDGIVIEQNFEKITTYSIGQVRVSELLGTYCGLQRLTTDNGGAEVYGGSDLVVVRGDYDTLLEIDLTPDARFAVRQARSYDAAAAEEFPGLIASRRNYDVAHVLDSDGQRHCGVLEQSWRIGGATPAEIAALEAFRAAPALRVVRASCTELYGASRPPAPDAWVYFRGVDDHVGSLTKYAMVEDYGNAR
jgi:Protein of unknown function (DUF3182)